RWRWSRAAEHLLGLSSPPRLPHTDARHVDLAQLRTQRPRPGTLPVGHGIGGEGGRGQAGRRDRGLRGQAADRGAGPRTAGLHHAAAAARGRHDRDGPRRGLGPGRRGPPARAVGACVLLRPGRRDPRPRPGAGLPRRRDHDRAVGARAAARARRLRRVLRVPRGPGRDPRPRGRQGRPHRVARRAPRRTGRAHAPPSRAHPGRRLRHQQRVRRRTPELCAVLAAGHVPVYLTDTEASVPAPRRRAEAWPVRWLRYLYRVPLLVWHLVIDLPVALLWMLGGERAKQRAVRWWSAWLMRIFGFRLRRRGLPLEGAVMFVANHVSWVDIVILHSQKMMG